MLDMGFCTKCGAKLNDGAKFCFECGSSTDFNQRKSVYDGELHKCPNCGEVLKSFTAKCPSCGYELRGTKISSTVNAFTAQLIQAESTQKKITIIRNFPIPNTIEDMLEFMILASSNIGEETKNPISEAWEAKIEQTYQKACLIFKNSPEFLKIQEIYDISTKKINDNKSRRVQYQHEKIRKEKHPEKVSKIKSIGEIISEIASDIPHLVVVWGWLISVLILIPLCRIDLDNVGTNGYQLGLIALLISGAIFMPIVVKKCSSLPKAVLSIGMILSIALMIPLCSKKYAVDDISPYILMLLISIICDTVIFFRMFRKKENEIERSSKAYSVIIVSSIVVFLIVYLISTAVVFVKNGTFYSKMTEEDHHSYYDDKNYNNKYDWPTNGLSEYLPKPESEYGEIQVNQDDYFNIEIYQSSKTQYEAYVESCKQEGFTVDIDTDENYYYAYNKDGYQLYLNFDSKGKYIDISLEAPIDMKDAKWPTTGIASTLPTIDDFKGNISSNGSDTFTVYVANTSIDEFNDYIDRCLEVGYDYDYDRHDKSFYATDKSGNDLTVCYEGFDIMYIYVRNWK